MTKLEQVINTVLKQQQKLLSASTYESRRYYCSQLLKLASQMDIDVPCQKLYDAFTARAGKSVNLRFQLNHCVKLIDSAAGTCAVRLDGILYNEPLLPAEDEVEIRLREASYPISAIDIGSLIIKARQEIRYLHLTESTSGQYLHAWKDLYRCFYIQGFAEYSFNGSRSSRKHAAALIKAWKKSACSTFRISEAET